MTNKVDQLLSHLINKNISDAKEMFDDLVRERVQDRIQERKIAVASSMMNDGQSAQNREIT